MSQAVGRLSHTFAWAISTPPRPLQFSPSTSCSRLPLHAVAILAKAMNASLLRQVQAAITARKTTLTEEEARAYAIRAVKWKRDRGRAPEVTSQDPWERQLAEGVAAFARYRAKAAAGD